MSHWDILFLLYRVRVRNRERGGLLGPMSVMFLSHPGHGFLLKASGLQEASSVQSWRSLLDEERNIFKKMQEVQLPSEETPRRLRLFFPPCYLWKHNTSHPNCKNYKVDISTSEGHSGGMHVRPVPFHYIIKVCDVKQRSQADSIIVSLYGRSKPMTPCSPRARWGNGRREQKPCSHVLMCIHLRQDKMLGGNYSAHAAHRKHEWAVSFQFVLTYTTLLCKFKIPLRFLECRGSTGT